MRPITQVVGPNATPGTASPPIRLDEWADAPLAIQVAVSGTVTFTVQHSFDDPNDLVSPVPVASMLWDTSYCPTGAINGSASLSFGIATAPLWVRILLSAGTGVVRLTATQYNAVEI